METIPKAPKGKPLYKKKCVICGKFSLIRAQANLCDECQIKAYGKARK